ncbi:MAG: TIGR03936 family radical SAM-associated protein [Syntrophomonadaceae bacterium]|nr:TIGR03936 family radical SAM-associated protein [Syntrophomonadaceae bacterium]
MKLRGEYRVDSELRFLGNFDMMHLMERSLRRGRIPFALTEGFNPHIRLSMGTVLPVGLYGRHEYFDLDLAVPMAPEELVAQLNRALPPALQLWRAVVLPERHLSLMQGINAAAYAFELEAAPEELRQLGERILKSAELIVASRGKKKNQVKDLRPGIYGYEARGRELLLWVSVNEPLNVRYDELLEMLQLQGVMPAQIKNYYREGNYVRVGERFFTPMEKLS